jgi:acetoin utilization deacetylase AcuC-like enzyme
MRSCIGKSGSPAAGMKIFYSDHFLVPLPAEHRFPMPKYARLHQSVRAAGIPGITLVSSQAASDAQLSLVHNPDYIQRMAQGKMTEKEMRRIGFPWSEQLVERSRRAVGGTIGTCRVAISEGFSANLAGGTHHAYPDHGEGYCVFNDVAVAVRVLQNEHLVERAVILDCDVHQGNGTAAIFSGDSNVFTFSIHGQKNFPFHKEISSLDVNLPDGCDDACYLDALRPALAQSLESVHADLAIYIAGADPFKGDALGRMAVSKAGLLERDRLVLSSCQAAGLPVAIVMGGGYARHIEDTVEIHLQTIRLGAFLANGFSADEPLNNFSLPSA